MRHEPAEGRFKAAAERAIFADIEATLARMGILPFFIGSSGYKVHAFSFWYALMYGLLVWVYIWLAQMLWRVERQAWLFLVMITMFYLILDFFALFGATTWGDVAVSVILNAVILLYCMLPGVRSAFGTDY